MNLWQAELLRWWREPGQRLILVAICVVWLVAGALGGISARDQRAAQFDAQQKWEAQLDQRRASALAAQSALPAQRAAAAFELGRHLGPRVALAPGPGLALSPGNREGAVHPQIGIETRHFDSRRAETLHNPGLSHDKGRGLVWFIAVLLPLALISACHGVRLGDRDAGRWRWINSLSTRPWCPVMWALGLRAGILLVLAALSSALALALDSGSTTAVFVDWLAALSLFVAVWLVLVALVTALPMTAQGGTLALMGVWALTTCALPAVLGELARSQVPMPSRLAAVVESRKVLQDAETRSDALLDEWYATHPESAPPSVPDKPHAWPVSFVPRYLEIDRQLRPLMSSFDSARVNLAQRLDRFALLSPALWLIGAGDALAGHTATRHERYAHELARREDLWRAQLVPAVMSYRGLEHVDFDQLKVLGDPVRLQP